MRWILVLSLFALLSLPAFAVGGACPSGANYTDPANPQGPLKTLANLGVTNCYYISATTPTGGVAPSDSNTGTDELHPWLHAPIMANCTANCASVNVSQGTQLAGTGFIFHGGDTWHYGHNVGDYTGGQWNWNPSCCGGPSGTITHTIYVGVDQAWFSGASWTRPLFTADNSPCNSLTVGTMPDGATCVAASNTTYFSSGLTYFGQSGFYVSACTYQAGSNNGIIAFGNQDYITLDNIEMTGICQSGAGISGGGNPSANIYVNYNSMNGPMVFENLYIHAASHVQYAGPLTSSPCNVANSVCANNAAFTGGLVNTATLPGDEVINNVVDFYGDSDPGGSFLCLSKGFYNTAYNVFRGFSSCLPSVHIMHDNLVEYMYENGHSNLFESSDPSGTNAIYNNTIRHIEAGVTSGGGVFLWFGPQSGATDYIFNNVMYDVGNGEYMNLGGNALTQVQGNYVVFNNTFQSNFSQPILRCDNQTIGTTLDTNNHAITDNGTYILGSGGSTCSSLTTTTSLCQSNTSGHFGSQCTTYSDSNSAPRFDQYTSTETFAYSPVASTNSTVVAGTNEISGYCAALGAAGLSAAQSACQNDTAYACSYNTSTHVISCPGRTVVARPTSSPWDIGAYEFSSGGSTTCSTPTFSPVSGTVFTQPSPVTMSSSCSTICYTTDGSTPTAIVAGTCSHGTAGNTVTILNITETVNALGTQSGDNNSAVGSASYTLNLLPPAPAYNMIIGEVAPRVPLSWQASSSPGVDYSVWRSTDGVNFNKVKAGITGLSWTDFKVTRGTTYSYETQAYYPPPCSQDCWSVMSNIVSLDCCQ